MSRKSNKSVLSTSADVEVVVPAVVEGEVVFDEPVALVEECVVETAIEEMAASGVDPVREELVAVASSEEVPDEQSKDDLVAAAEGDVARLEELLKQAKRHLRSLKAPDAADGKQSKMDLAVALYREYRGTNWSRKDYIKAFQDDCGMTLAGARTYIQIIMTKDKAGKL
jgi:enoyl reductase-like protein